LISLLPQENVAQPRDRLNLLRCLSVGEHPRNRTVSLDFIIKPTRQFGRVDLCSMLSREDRMDQHIGLGTIDQHRPLREALPQPIYGLLPLLACCVDSVMNKGTSECSLPDASRDY
jgi:hypothetical protein